jgi:hypothetical protein
MGTLANHRYPRAACNHNFPDAGVNIGLGNLKGKISSKTVMVDIPKKPAQTNLVLFELSDLKGFLRSTQQMKDVFIEFTPTGPEFFLFADNGIDRCDKSVLPDDRYVPVSRNIAADYAFNTQVLDEVLSMALFKRDEWKRNVSFMRIDTGISAATGATHYFPVSAAYTYGVTTVFEFSTHALTTIDDREAKDAENKGKRVYTADKEFAYGEKLTLESGYKKGEEHYLVIPFKPSLKLPRAYLFRVELSGDIELKIKSN